MGGDTETRRGLGLYLSEMQPVPSVMKVEGFMSLPEFWQTPWLTFTFYTKMQGRLLTSKVTWGETHTKTVSSISIF